MEVKTRNMLQEVQPVARTNMILRLFLHIDRFAPGLDGETGWFLVKTIYIIFQKKKNQTALHKAVGNQHLVNKCLDKLKKMGKCQNKNY